MPNPYQLLNSFYGQVSGRNRWRIRKMAQQTMSLSPEAIREASLRLFQERVWKAIQRFPYYRDFFLRETGGLPRTPDAILPENTPIWQRSNQWDLFHTADYAQQVPRDSFLHSTGGSTGQPMCFYVTRDSYEWRRAVSDRGYSWAGAQEGRRSFYVWGTSVAPPPLLSHLKFAMHHILERRIYFDSFHFNDARKEQCTRLINRKRPFTLVGYTGNLVELALFLKEHPGLLQYQVEGIVPAAEGLHPGQRELLEEVFGGQVFMSYGSREFMLIGMECKEHNGYHLSADNLYVEVVDEQGSPCRPGEVGRILVTDLKNEATPFIRYEIGDMGTATDPAHICSCGNPLPKLGRVEGRLQENIVLPDGSKLTALFIPHLMKEFTWINGYQIRQNQPGDITVKLRTSEAITDALCAPIADAIRERSSENMHIEFERVSQLRRSLSGKTPIIEPTYGGRREQKTVSPTRDDEERSGLAATAPTFANHPSQAQQAKPQIGAEKRTAESSNAPHPPTVAHLVLHPDASLLDQICTLAAARNADYPSSTFIYTSSSLTGKQDVRFRHIHLHRFVIPWSQRTVSELTRYLGQDDVDIVHTHDSLAQLYAALATSKMAIGHIFTYHDAKFGRIRKLSLQHEILGRVTDECVADSDETAACLIQTYGIDKDDVHVLQTDRALAYETFYSRLALKYRACKVPFEKVFTAQDTAPTSFLHKLWPGENILTQLRYHGITAKIFPKCIRSLGHRLLPRLNADKDLWMTSYRNVLRKAVPATNKLPGVKLAIVKDLMLRHSYYEAACLELGVPYDVVDITGPDWVDAVTQHTYDAWLVRPFVQSSLGKQIYDERLKQMKEQLDCQIFPSVNELWLYESKRRLADWLRIHQFPHPETHVFINQQDAINFLAKAKFPLVFKTDMGAESLGVSILRNRRQAIQVVKKCFGSGFRIPRRDPRDRERGVVLFQNYIQNAKEWRIVRIGNSFFGHQKKLHGQFHSGSKEKVYERPPQELLQFAARITDVGKFDSMSIDVFETQEGSYLVNELQTYFGSLMPHQLKIGGQPGRYRYDQDSGTFTFEAGDFARNACCNLRVALVLERLGISPPMDWV